MIEFTESEKAAIKIAEELCRYSDLNTTYREALMNIANSSPHEWSRDRAVSALCSTVEGTVDVVFYSNLDKVNQALEKPGLLGWFVGQAMKACGGRHNPLAIEMEFRKAFQAVKEDVEENGE